jgi:hypothetical protein
MRGQEYAGDESFHPWSHFISANPLNILLFQQAGLTYEFKLRHFGFGLTGGEIYANHQEYSNFFIAGPTEEGSLGDYSGYFFVPQINYYFTKQKYRNHAHLFYVSFKFVYKHMSLDSTNVTKWMPADEGDGYYDWRKMIDKVNIYGEFIGVGYKYALYHVFLQVEFGFGAMEDKHTMIISQENPENGSPYPMYYHYNPPERVSAYQNLGSINFNLSIGGTF